MRHAFVVLLLLASVTSGCRTAMHCELDPCADDEICTRSGCRPDTCGNGEQRAGEECDDGELNSDERPDACRADCTLPRCGDGVRDSVEECDDATANSDTSPDACRSGCTLPRCGDGVVDTGEQCDDGNTTPGDGCDDVCDLEILPPACGNGQLDPGEECDDGNLRSHDGCSSGCTAEVWEWVEMSPTASPSPRTGSAMSYDPLRGRIVLFGGVTDGLVSLDDTWEYYGTAWTKATLVAQPSPRGHHSMTYDSSRACLILFGGSGTGGDETWERCGSAWVLSVLGTRPPARSNHAITFDSQAGQVLLFGGFSGTLNPNYLQDTWVYNGVSWEEASLATLPGRRSDHAMAHDAGRGRSVLFGGFDGTAPPYYLADTWEHDGSAWAEVSTTGAPRGRSDHALVYHAARGRILLFGGHNASVTPSRLDDTWEYDGADWVPFLTPSSPPRRAGHAMAYDASTGRVILFGGSDNGLLGDTWELRLQSEWPDEICLNGIDDDGDSLTDCDDPDCSGSPGCP